MGGCFFCKKVDLFPHNGTKLMLDIFYFTFYLFGGCVRTQRTPLPTGSYSPACTWHRSLHYVFLQATPLFPHVTCAFVISVQLTPRTSPRYDARCYFNVRSKASVFIGSACRANYIQGGDADISCSAWLSTTLFGVVI